MRVVLDTNILVSAGWKPGGLEARVLEMVWSGGLLPFATQWTWAEYERVLRRRNFGALQAWVDSTLPRLDALLHWCVAYERLAVAKDEDDNRFLECAAAAGAAYLITGNGRHFPGEFAGARVRNARAFLLEFEAVHSVPAAHPAYRR